MGGSVWDALLVDPSNPLKLLSFKEQYIVSCVLSCKFHQTKGEKIEMKIINLGVLHLLETT